MINFTLYFREMKSSWKMLVVFGAVLTLYVTMIISMYDPSLAKTLQEFRSAMPELMAAVGMDGNDSTLIGFMSSYLYGMILIVFPMIFSIMRAHGLIAKYVDRGSMTTLLAAPVKRRTIAFTQMKVLASGVFLLVIYTTVLEIIGTAAFPGELNLSDLFLLNFGLIWLQLMIAAICFLSSCIFGDAKFSIGFGAGIPTVMYVMQMLSAAGESAKFFRYVSIFTLFQPEKIIARETSALVGIAVLAIGSILTFAVAIEVFARKDMHI